MKGLRPLCRAAACTVFGVALATAQAQPAVRAPAEIVIGQSLPMSGPFFEVAQAVQSGAKAQLERINREGGIQGRPLRLVTLDDRGDPAVLRDNLRRLVAEMGAVALSNCLGDAACRVAAEQAERLRVPLVGALSGSRELRRTGLRQVFNLRAGYEREGAAIARQLTVMGAKRVALVDDASGTEAAAAVAQALAAKGIDAVRLTLADSGDKALQGLVERLGERPGQAPFDAAVLALSLPTVSRLEAARLVQRPEWPALVMSLAMPGLTQTALVFGARGFAFSNVVPNPDRSAMPLVRAFQADMEQFGTGWGATFEGLEAYLNLGACVAGLRGNKGPPSPEALSTALRALGAISLGGFALDFSEGRTSASDWVDVGVLTRGRIFVR